MLFTKFCKGANSTPAAPAPLSCLALKQGCCEAGTVACSRLGTGIGPTAGRLYTKTEGVSGKQPGSLEQEIAGLCEKPGHHLYSKINSKQSGFGHGLPAPIFLPASNSGPTRESSHAPQISHKWLSPSCQPTAILPASSPADLKPSLCFTMKLSRCPDCFWSFAESRWW